VSRLRWRRARACEPREHHGFSYIAHDIAVREHRTLSGRVTRRPARRGGRPGLTSGFAPLHNDGQLGPLFIPVFRTGLHRHVSSAISMPPPSSLGVSTAGRHADIKDVTMRESVVELTGFRSLQRQRDERTQLSEPHQRAAGEELRESQSQFSANSAGIAGVQVEHRSRAIGKPVSRAVVKPRSWCWTMDSGSRRNSGVTNTVERRDGPQQRRIEGIRGPASRPVWLDALGGVVNVCKKDLPDATVCRAFGARRARVRPTAVPAA